MASVLRPAVCLRQTRPIWLGIRPLSQQASQGSTSDSLRTSSILTKANYPSIPPRQPTQKGPCKPPMPASFHTSPQKQILPPGPPMSAALIPLTIAPFAAGTLNPITDALLCAGIIIHSHIGFQSIIIDYVPDKRLPKTHALFWWGLRLATSVVAIGFFEFETNDIGLTEAIKKIWTAKRTETAYVEPVLRGVA
ncbi:MAG: hypothetical protein Q9188_000251 [Gyalolechia gomerana]